MYIALKSNLSNILVGHDIYLLLPSTRKIALESIADVILTSR